MQEIAYALATAIAVLDAVRDSGQVPAERFGEVVARISFFVNAGVRFVEEMCKMRAFVELWDELTASATACTDAKQRRFRYGVQVNSLGLTEAQPENNVQRIVLEMLGGDPVEGRPCPRRPAAGVERGARAAAAVGPAVVAADAAGAGLRVRPAGVRRPVRGLGRRRRARSRSWWPGARAELDRVQAMGGAVAAVETGYMKSALVGSHAARRGRIESGEDVVVGVNRFTTTEPNPLLADLDAAIQTVDPHVEQAAASMRCGVAAESRRGERCRGTAPACRGGRRHRRTSCRRHWSAPGRA